MPGKLTVIAALLGMLCHCDPAWARPARVAVLQPDAELMRAISLALSPWGIEAIVSHASAPPSSQPEAVQQASALSRELDVEAVVWMTRLEQGSLLWVFDVKSDDVTTRQLIQAPPLDGVSAAAVALSVKTILRASVMDTEQEPEGLDLDTVRVFALELGAGGYRMNNNQLDLRGDVEAVFWLPAQPSLGFSVEVASGPGLLIETSEYQGRYREVVVGGRVRWRFVDVPKFTTAAAVGGAAHWTRLFGTLAAGRMDSEVRRLNGSVDFSLLLNFAVSSRVYLGASVGAAYSPAYRRYLVQGDPIFSPRPLNFNLTGYCGVELF